MGWTSPGPFSNRFLPRRPKKGDGYTKEKKRIGHDDWINAQAKVELLFSHVNSYVGVEMAKVARVVATKTAENRPSASERSSLLHRCLHLTDIFAAL